MTPDQMRAKKHAELVYRCWELDCEESQKLQPGGSPLPLFNDASLAKEYLAIAERLERERGEGFTVSEIRILYQAIRDRMQSTERELGYECQHLRDLLRKIDFMKQQPDIQPRGAAK